MLEKPRGPEQIRAYNEAMWDAKVGEGNRWTKPVSPEVIEEARLGNVSIVLTPHLPVPVDWFPPLADCEILCLAGAGGQQGPVLAAAGAKVTVFDNSPNQLAQDRLVADREGLDLRTVKGDMRDLGEFTDACFDLIFHPCSNGFIPDVQPVWNEAFRVLRPGGSLLSGFANPVDSIFDTMLREDKGELKVRHRIPYSDLTSITDEEFSANRDMNEPAYFGHTLDDQIGGQIAAGFAITGFFEDDWGPDSDDVLAKFIKTYIATKSTKLA